MQESTARTSGTRRVYGGLYSDPTAAERGIRRFRDSGYEGERIGIISRNRDEAKDVAENTGASAAAGAATGAVAGGLLGGLTGLLVGIGAGVGAVSGGLVGALTNLGFEKDEAEYYDTGVRNGRTLVTIHDDDGRSESIFDETGAERYRRPTTGTSSRAL